MQKRLKEKKDAYDAQWDNGNGSHHPDYDPTAAGDKVCPAAVATADTACHGGTSCKLPSAASQYITSCSGCSIQLDTSAQAPPTPWATGQA
jgi:hypothetical protein